MLAAIIIGLFVGIVAKLLVPGRDPGGIFVTILIGIAGSILARWIGIQAGFYLPDESAGFFAAVLGSVILLVAYRMLTARRRIV